MQLDALHIHWSLWRKHINLDFNGPQFSCLACQSHSTSYSKPRSFETETSHSAQQQTRVWIFDLQCRSRRLLVFKSCENCFNHCVTWKIWFSLHFAVQKDRNVLQSSRSMAMHEVASMVTHAFLSMVTRTLISMVTHTLISVLAHILTYGIVTIALQLNLDTYCIVLW